MTEHYDLFDDVNMNFADFATFNAPDTYTDISPEVSPFTPNLDFTPASTASTPSTTTTFTNPTTSTQGNPPSKSAKSSGAGVKRAAPSDEDDDTTLKRQRNTLAARKYRQKRLDRIKELEDALDEVTRERDDMRIRLARQEAETEALKTLMKMRLEK